MGYLNKQEIFDKVATHLFTQKAVSTNGLNCQYRSSNGLKCALGALIPDDLYDSSIENFTPDYITSSIIDAVASGYVYELKTGEYKLAEAMFNSGINLADDDIKTLCVDLQGAHDSGIYFNEKIGSYEALTGDELLKRWRRLLTYVAEEFKLNASILDTFHD